MPIAPALVAELDHETVATRATLERVPLAQRAWKPHAISMSLGDLALHLAMIPEWGAVTVREREFDVAPVGKPAWVPPAAATTAELLALYDRHLADCRAALAAASDAALMEPWSLKKAGAVVFTLPRVAVLRSMVFSHAVHHRAQLGVYLRLLDVPLPAVYGPSADAQT